MAFKTARTTVGYEILSGHRDIRRRLNIFIILVVLLVLGVNVWLALIYFSLARPDGLGVR